MKTWVLVILVFSLFGLQAPAILAQEKAAAKCQFESDLKELGLLSDKASLDHLQKIKTELGIRKKILLGIIDCALDEIQLLKAKLEGVAVEDQAIAWLKASLLLETDQTIDFYKNQARTIPDLGISGSKSLAKQLFERRSTNYSDWTTRVVSLISWTNSQEIIRLTEKRLGEIKKTLVNLAVNDPGLARSLAAAEDNLKRAKEADGLARRAILASGQANRQLSMIKDALEAVAEVYKNFFEISDALASKARR